MIKGMIPGDRLTDPLRQELTATVPDRRLLSAWLSGSHARGEARSDIDVGMLSDEPLDSASLFDVSGRLAARLGATVDLVDLRRAGGLLRVEATHHGRPLVPPTFEADLFTTHAMPIRRSLRSIAAPQRKPSSRSCLPMTL